MRESGSDDGDQKPLEESAPAGRERFHARELTKVLSNWDLGVIHEIREYRRGSRRSPKIRIFAEKGSFLLKRKAGGQREDRAQRCHELQLDAERGGVPLAALVPRRSGGTLLAFDARLYECFRWVPGTRYGRRAGQARNAGIALARLHGAFVGKGDLAELPEGGFSDTGTVRTQLERAIERVRERDGERAEEIDAVAARLRGVLDRAEAKLVERGLPLEQPEVCHGDFHSGNTLWNDDTLAAVIDFDSARREPHVAEIANALLHFAMRPRRDDAPETWTVALEPDCLRAFMQGYVAFPPNDPGRMAPMIPWLMQAAMIAETATPIAREGDFAGIAPMPVLRYSAEVCEWIAQRSRAISALADS